MTHVVTEPCFGCKYTDCVDVCPVDCFHEGEQMLYINPEECIDCQQCVAVCPVEAISTKMTSLGASASHALPALEALAAHDRNDKVRKQAQDAIDKISAGAPARLELKRLRDELKKLSQANQTLSGRLEKLEHKQPEPVEGKTREAG